MSDLPPRAPANHGNTAAAWVTTGGIAVGALLVCMSLILDTGPWLWVGGIGAMVVSLLVGKAMQALGYGQPQDD